MGPMFPGSMTVGGPLQGFPWIDTFSVEMMNMYMVVQQANEENRALKARIADLEQHLVRARKQLEHYRGEFQTLRDEADRVLRNWGRELVLVHSPAREDDSSD